MRTGRKIIGVLVIVLFGLPTLFGIIWAVGLIRGSVSPEFLTDLPRDIIAAIPDKAEEIFRDAQDDRIISDPNTRAWFQAAAKTGISPRQLMEQTGLLQWMKGQLSDSLRDIGPVLRGEERPHPITIDLRPLKEAILSPEVGRFLEATVANLPPCDERGQEVWADIAAKRPGHRELPACRPAPSVSQEVMLSARTEAVRDMSDEVEVFDEADHFPFLPFGVSGTVAVLSYFMFLIPAAFIFFGALIGASSPGGVFRWSGVSVLVGGISALVLGLATKYVSLWAIKAAPSFGYRDWGTELGDLVLDKLRWIPTRIVDQLFSPVVGVAAVVCLAGVVLYALSFSVRNTPRSGGTAVATTPAQPSQPKSGPETK
jgi:hypothetical protein